jgi:hypothetical protein
LRGPCSGNSLNALFVGQDFYNTVVLAGCWKTPVLYQGTTFSRVPMSLRLTQGDENRVRACA